MKAHLLSLNAFNRPEVLEGIDAKYIHILYLLLLDKGKFQSHPDMGVGLRTRYKFSDEDSLMYLKNDIEQQIRTYLPDVYEAEVDLILDDSNVLYINIAFNNNVYQVNYNIETGKIDVATSKQTSL